MPPQQPTPLRRRSGSLTQESMSRRPRYLITSDFNATNSSVTVAQWLLHGQTIAKFSRPMNAVPMRSPEMASLWTLAKSSARYPRLPKLDAQVPN